MSLHIPDSTGKELFKLIIMSVLLPEIGTGVRVVFFFLTIKWKVFFYRSQQEVEFFFICLLD